MGCSVGGTFATIPTFHYCAALIVLRVAMGRRAPSKNVCERARAPARVSAWCFWGTALVFNCLDFS